MRPPAHLELEALYRVLQGDEGSDGLALLRQLGRLAAHDGFAQRFLLAVVHGRLHHSSQTVVESLRELAKSAPAIVISLLESHDSSASLAAGCALGREYAACGHALLAAADSADESVRLAAAAGLGEGAAAGSPDAVEALGRLLFAENPSVRWSAAVNLGAARGRASGLALSLLGEALSSKDELILSGVVFGLARLWPARKRDSMALLLKAAQAGNSTRRAAALAMKQLPRRAAARLANVCLRDEDSEIRALCANALAVWGRDSNAARQALLRLTRDSSAPVRAAAAEQLVSTSMLAEDATISKLASDTSALVRAAVGEGIARGKRTDLQEVAARLAQDEAALVRAAAVRSLTSPAARPLAQQAGRYLEPVVRAAAASALTPDRPESNALLLELTRDADPSVVRAAAQALGRCAEPDSGLAWERLLELAKDGTARSAAAAAIAVVLDQNPIQATDILWRHQIGQGQTDLFARVARTATQWPVAEVARTADYALHCDESSLVEGIRDLAVALNAVGKQKKAAAMNWLADCAAAELRDLNGIARAPNVTGEAAIKLKQVARALAPSARAALGERRLSRGLASLEELLAQEAVTIEWMLVRRVAQLWREVLLRDVKTMAGEVTAWLLSRTVLSGGRGTLVIVVRNRAQEVATDLLVRIGDAETPAPNLAPGESCEIEVPYGPGDNGHSTIRGTLCFRLRGVTAETRFEGSVNVAVPRPLGTAVNPYVVGKPLAPDSPMFFGRSRELAQAQRALGTGQNGSVLVLVGPRRIGKTSLLKKLAVQLSYNYRAAYLDVQGLLVADTEDFFKEVARAAARNVGDSLSDGDLQLRGRGPDMVREVAAHYDRPVVLLFDEFDDLDEKVRRGRLSAEVFGYLRNLVQHSENIRVVLSGTHRLEELAGDHWSFLLNLATYRRIGCLQPEEAEMVLTEPFARLGIAWEEAALFRALRLTGGHPYLLQLLGYRLVEECVASGEGAARVALVEEAAEQVIEQGDIHLRYLWETAKEGGKALLQALAGRDAGLTEEELGKSLGFEPPSLRKLLKQFTAAELVVGRESRYTLRMGLFSRWLQRAQPDK